MRVCLREGNESVTLGSRMRVLFFLVCIPSHFSESAGGQGQQDEARHLPVRVQPQALLHGAGFRPGRPGVN